MSKLMEFTSGNGRVVIAVESAEDEVVPVGARDTAIEKARASLDEMLAMIGNLARSLHHALADAPVQSAEVTFGLKFAGKGTIYVVESSAEASLSVKLTLKAADSPAT